MTGYEPDEANRLTRLVAAHAGDEEAEARGDAKGAAEKLAAGKDVTGLPRLCELLGLLPEMAGVFAKWLGSALSAEGAIILDNDKEPENLDKMDAAFAASELRHYQRGGKRVYLVPCATADGQQGALIIQECSRRVIQQDAQRILPFRKFDARTRAGHPRLLAAALTIIRAYVVAGHPMQGRFTPMGSFGDFDRLVRAPLLWLGCADPLDTQREIETVDPEAEALARGLELLEAAFGEGPFQVKDIASSFSLMRAGNPAALSEWIRENISPPRDNSPVNTKALGQYLSKHRGTPHNGRRLVLVTPGSPEARGKLNHDGKIWRVGRPG